jgi:hypothetical protein
MPTHHHPPPDSHRQRIRHPAPALGLSNDNERAAPNPRRWHGRTVTHPSPRSRGQVLPLTASPHQVMAARCHRSPHQLSASTSTGEATTVTQWQCGTGTLVVLSPPTLGGYSIATVPPAHHPQPGLQDQSGINISTLHFAQQVSSQLVRCCSTS